MTNSSSNMEGVLSGGDLVERSEFARLFGFLQPQAAMQDIVARPACVVPIALSALAGMAYTVVLRPDLRWTQSQTFQATLGTAAGVLVRVLLMAGVLTAFAAIVSRATVSFRQVLGVVAYARVPGVLATVLAILLILLRRSAGLPDGHPVNPMLTNLAIFLDPRTTSRFVYFLASSVDCIFFWQLSLMAVGLRLASKLSSGASNAAVVVLWVLYAFGQALWVR